MAVTTQDVYDVRYVRSRRLFQAGKRFGLLVVESLIIPSGGGLSRVMARCDCGNVLNILSRSLTSGNTSSCGCLRRRGLIARSTTHGKRHTPEYKAWAQMLARCFNHKATHYEDYGGRGITVCDRWHHDFAAFYADMGQRPSATHSLDRWPNNDGNYEPSNCRWATKFEQANNRRPAKSTRWSKHGVC